MNARSRRLRSRTGQAAVFTLLGGLPVPAGGASERGAAPGTDEPPAVRFAVEPGTRLRKTFERELRLTTRAGRPRMEVSLLGRYEYDHEVEVAGWRDFQRVVLVDSFGASDDGPPASFARRFDEVEMEHTHDWSMPPVFGRGFAGTVERAGRGELAGAEVEFVRAREGEPELVLLHEARYVVRLVEEGELDGLEPDERAERLADLTAAADLTSLLPWRAVAVGDHWFTDVEAFRELCWPGGTLGFLDFEGDPLVVPVDERLARHLDGTFRVELASIEEVDGVRFARLDVRGRLESTATFEYEWVFEVLGGEHRTRGPIRVDLYASVDATVWWNLDAHHLDSVELQGDVDVTQDLGGLDGEIEWKGWSTTARILGDQRAWRGTLTASARFERL